MGVQTQTFRFAPVEAATTPTISNIESPGTANTEFSHTLTVNTKVLTIKARGATTTKIAVVSGETVTNYITLPAYATYHTERLNLGSVTLYFSCDKASQIIEIFEWQ